MLLKKIFFKCCYKTTKFLTQMRVRKWIGWQWPIDNPVVIYTSLITPIYSLVRTMMCQFGDLPCILISLYEGPSEPEVPRALKVWTCPDGVLDLVTPFDRRLGDGCFPACPFWGTDVTQAWLFCQIFWLLVVIEKFYSQNKHGRH